VISFTELFKNETSHAQTLLDFLSISLSQIKVKMTRESTIILLLILNSYFLIEFDSNNFKDLWYWKLHQPILKKLNNNKEVFTLQPGTSCYQYSLFLGYFFPKDHKLLTELGLHTSETAGNCHGNKKYGVFILKTSKESCKQEDTLVNITVTKHQIEGEPKPAIDSSIRKKFPMYLFIEEDKVYQVFGPFCITKFRKKGPSVTLQKIDISM